MTPGIIESSELDVGPFATVIAPVVRIALSPLASVNGVPIFSAGISAAFGSFRSKSSSALLFLFASESTSVTGISSPEPQAPSAALMSIVAKPKPTTTLFDTSLYRTVADCPLRDVGVDRMSKLALSDSS